MLRRIDISPFISYDMFTPVFIFLSMDCHVDTCHYSSYEKLEFSLQIICSAGTRVVNIHFTNSSSSILYCIIYTIHGACVGAGTRSQIRSSSQPPALVSVGGIPNSSQGQSYHILFR